jgi:hypothetical protein
MNTEIEKAIKALTEKSHDKDVKSHEALQWTQAALNLAHVAQVLKQT